MEGINNNELRRNRKLVSGIWYPSFHVLEARPRCVCFWLDFARGGRCVGDCVDDDTTVPSSSYLCIGASHRVLSLCLLITPLRACPCDALSVLTSKRLEHHGITMGSTITNPLGSRFIQSKLLGGSAARCNAVRLCYTLLVLSGSFSNAFLVGKVDFVIRKKWSAW